VTWRELNREEQIKVIECFFDSKDGDDIRQDIVDTLCKGDEYRVNHDTVATWFDLQDKEFQLEILQT